MSACDLPYAHLDLNRYRSVKAVRNSWNDADIGAKSLALDRQHRQRRKEPSAITIVRIAIECAYGDARTYIEARPLPVKRAPLIGSVVRPLTIAVDKRTGHQCMVAGQPNFCPQADIVITQTFARIEMVRVDSRVEPDLGKGSPGYRLALRSRGK